MDEVLGDFAISDIQSSPLEMKGQVYASCVRSSMTYYGSETRPLLADVGLNFVRAEMQMIRWMWIYCLMCKYCRYNYYQQIQIIHMACMRQ